MRSILRTGLDTALARDIALACVAVGLVGLSYGAIAVSSGMPLWLPIVMSFVVFAGASQFLFVSLLAGGANPLTAVIAGLIINSRHLPFGLAVSDALGTGPRRFLGAHLMTDESVGFAFGQTDPSRRKAAYWMAGAGIFVVWNVTVILGALGGDLITDTAALGLDAAFPAILMALVMPSLRAARVRNAAMLGALVAVALTPYLPPGVPILLSLAGLLLLVGRDR